MADKKKKKKIPLGVGGDSLRISERKQLKGGGGSLIYGEFRGVSIQDLWTGGILNVAVFP